ncbi:MAG: hypothetical protein ACR2LR_17860 [Hassallia sp.]
MGVELGIWHDRSQNLELPWLRWWDDRGSLLLTAWESSEPLAGKLKEFGVNP